MADDFGPRWRTVWENLRLTPPAVLDEVIAAYDHPSRHYHSLEHVRDCLSRFDEVRAVAEHPEEVELAIWFHDAVYDPVRSDNEIQSAAWARRVVLGAGGSEDLAERVGRLIAATDHRVPMDGGDAALLCDLDLSILGAPPDLFDRYEQQIRAEYAWVPEQQYREARATILRRFVERPRVFVTDTFYDRYEGQARENLHRSLARIEQDEAP